jgi:hypothetical protein
MTVSLEQQVTHFESLADPVADVLRNIGSRWGGTEQMDNTPAATPEKRFALQYAYPDGDNRGHVYADFWYGASGTLRDENDGRVIELDLDAEAYRCGRIDVVFVADHGGDDFLIDGNDMVHSVQELRDRLIVLWNGNTWLFQRADLAKRAVLYSQYIQTDAYFKANLRPVGAMLKKLGGVWGGEEQSDNTPDPDDEKSGIGGLMGGGKKRCFVGFMAPQFKDEDLPAVTPGAVWLEVWQGKKGIIRKSEQGRVIKLAEKTSKRVTVKFPLGSGIMQLEGVSGAKAQSADEMKALLAKLWKEKALGI